jgi:hypothetical protein
VEVGEEFLFFGNPRFLGRTLTIADEGEISVKKGGPTMLSGLEQSSQARKDAPVVGRIVAAKLVFRGTVESVNSLEKAAEESRQTAVPPSEHDPEWQVANVRISKPLRGGDPRWAELALRPHGRWSKCRSSGTYIGWEHRAVRCSFPFWGRILRSRKRNSQEDKIQPESLGGFFFATGGMWERDNCRKQA